MKDLLIYGCGSVGRMIEQIVFDINRKKPVWNLLGFIDDNPSEHGKSVAGLKVLGDIEVLNEYPSASLVIGFANPQRKQQIVHQLDRIGRSKFATLIHPRSWVGRRVEIGHGCIFYPGVYVDVDVKLGNHILLNKNCTVGHDTRIGDFTTAAPGVNLGGSNNIEIGVDFGINCASIHELTIGAWSIIGAGSIVIRDVPVGRVYAGVPARDLKSSLRSTQHCQLVLVGAGGFGREVAWTAIDMNRKLSRLEQWQLVGYADDNPDIPATGILNLPVLGRPEDVKLKGPVWFYCAIGNNLHRREMVERCLRLNWKPATLIHSSALKAESVTISEGTYIGAGSIINPDVKINRFALINQRVAIGHDTIIEEFAQLNPGAQINGNCQIGEGASIGSNASLHPGIKVGRRAVVGSNSQVVRDVPPNTTVNGVPARKMF